MAAAIKAINARIRANPVTDYLCSTHFWGPASNFGIPLAAITDIQKDPELISRNMTVALTGYSGVFIRYALAVTPKNYLLFGMHCINFSAQVTQGYRYVQYWHMGGREEKLRKEAEQDAQGVVGQVKSAVEAIPGKVQEGVNKITGK